jgi:hypothetical protein
LQVVAVAERDLAQVEVLVVFAQLLPQQVAVAH